MPQTGNGMVFPGFYVTLDSYEALSNLRRRPDLDYVEPFGLALFDSCSFDVYTPAVNRPELTDGALSLPFGSGSDIVPNTFIQLRIREAWDRVLYPGLGVRVAVLDTGVSPDQDQLGSQFTVGAPRGAATHLPLGSSADSCAHGTKVAATVAAPRDGRNIVGILSGAGLTTVRVTSAPATAALTAASVCSGVASAQSAGAHVTMMAFGFIFSSPTVEACIRSTFDSTSMVFVAAAGTSVPNVVFPATMNREVVAAGVVERFSAAEFRLIGSGVAYGPDVDVVSVMGYNKFPTAGAIGNAGTQQISAFGATSGAVPHIGGISLAAHLTYWHDMFNSVVVRVKYTVSQPAGILCDVPTAMF